MDLGGRVLPIHISGWVDRRVVMEVCGWSMTDFFRWTHRATSFSKPFACLTSTPAAAKSEGMSAWFLVVVIREA